MSGKTEQLENGLTIWKYYPSNDLTVLHISALGQKPTIVNWIRDAQVPQPSDDALQALEKLLPQLGLGKMFWSMSLPNAEVERLAQELEAYPVTSANWMSTRNVTSHSEIALEKDAWRMKVRVETTAEGYVYSLKFLTSVVGSTFEFDVVYEFALQETDWQLIADHLKDMG
jgi:hypothetical protein